LIGLLGAALVVFSAWLAWLSRPQAPALSRGVLPVCKDDAREAL
jgi:hypothetical protein